MSIIATNNAKSWISSFFIVTLAFQGLNWGCGKTTFGAFGGGEKKSAASDPNAAASGDAVGGDAVSESFSVSEIAKASKVDVIVLFDTSGSMDDEMGKLRAELPNFVKNLQANLSNEDFQVFLVMDQNDLSYVKQGDEPVITVDKKVGSNNSLEILSEFLDEQKSGKFAPLRKDAALEIIVVSDDDASIKPVTIGNGKDREKIKYTPMDYFNNLLKTHALGTRTRLHGLVFQPDGQETEWCTRASDGKNYIEIAAKTQGVVNHLCQEEWDKVLSDFSSEIIGTVKSNVRKLSSPVFEPALDQMQVEINGAVVEAKCYSFAVESNTITIEKSCITGAAAEVKVTYIPKT